MGAELKDAVLTGAKRELQVRGLMVGELEGGGGMKGVLSGGRGQGIAQVK